MRHGNASVKMPKFSVSEHVQQANYQYGGYNLLGSTLQMSRGLQGAGKTDAVIPGHNLIFKQLWAAADGRMLVFAPSPGW